MVFECDEEKLNTKSSSYHIDNKSEFDLMFFYILIAKVLRQQGGEKTHSPGWVTLVIQIELNNQIALIERDLKLNTT